jgi:hypothetical protein
MQQVKTAFLLVLMTVLLVLVGGLLFGTTGTYAFLALAIVMNGSAYWFSDRIARAGPGGRSAGSPDSTLWQSPIATKVLGGADLSLFTGLIVTGVLYYFLAKAQVPSTEAAPAASPARP